MPPPLLIDPATIDTNDVQYDKGTIYQRLPHGFEFEMLDGVYFVDKAAGQAAAYRECRLDDWWVRGHVPGRPIFPGVLQIETGAQLIAFMSRCLEGPSEQFVALGGVENCRFREAVFPPAHYMVIAKMVEDRSRRIKTDVQGLVEGRLVFEARITGLALR